MKTTDMKLYKLFPFLMLGCLLLACNSEPSLQEYYVQKTEDPNFLSFDLPVSLLNLDEVALPERQRAALEAVRKMNILAFKRTEENETAYNTERNTVMRILSDTDMTELMKMRMDFGQATISFTGGERSIDEIIIYGNSEEKGFALVRVLGDNMNPADFIQLLKAMEKADVDGDQLSGLKEFFQ